MNELQIGVAGDDQRRAFHANVHDVWSRGFSLAEHVERRMNSPLHQRAIWYVGSLEGKVVSGLGCHPLIIRLRGADVPAIGIASVHTLAEFRGRGYAPQLIAHAEAAQRRRGARLALLFSDVDPCYYARLGYQLCPAHQGESLPAVAGSAPEGRFWRFTPGAAVSKLSQLFESHYGRNPLLIARPDEYLRHLIARSPADEFFWFILEEAIVGYVRLSAEESRLKLRDYAVRDGDSRLRDKLFAALTRLAAQRESSVVGWLPDEAITRTWFRVKPRETEITMVKPLDPAIELDAACRAAADQICEIDHV